MSTTRPTTVKGSSWFIIAPHLTVRLTLGHVQVIMATAPREVAHGLLALLSTDTRKTEASEQILGHWLIAVATSSAAATIVLAEPGPAGLVLAAAALLAGVGTGVSINLAATHNSTRPRALPASRYQGILITILGAAVGVVFGILMWASASAIGSVFNATL